MKRKMEKKRVLILGIAAALFIANIFAWQEVFALTDTNLHVWFLDVGQGDSEFVETPDGRQILIDGGPNSTVLEKISGIMGFFDRKIDIVVLSHPEKDHVQGLVEVLKKYKTDYIVQSGVERDSDEFREWQEVLNRQRKMGAEIINVKAGDIVRLENAELEILYPFEDLSGQKMTESSNEVCIVAKLIYGQNSFLFTGDIGTKTEQEIIESGENMDCDVLKVSHHGSKYSTSEDFLQNGEPKFAVIEVGKNSYGHPTQDVLQRLAGIGAETFRTDQNGTVEIVSDGNSVLFLD